MKQTLLVICETAILEAASNKVSLIGIFEKIAAGGLPVMYPKFVVFNRFDDGEGSHDIKIKIVSENLNKVIASLEDKISFNSSSKRSQYVGSFIGLPFPEFGKYRIEVYVDNNIQPLTGFLEIIKQN